MASISTIVQSIRQAVFGKDVRESIASGIEAISDQQDSYEQSLINRQNSYEQEITGRQGNVETRQTNLENTFNQEIANQSVEDPSNMETVAARTDTVNNVTYGTLQERLDIHALQLTDKAEKNFVYYDDYIKESDNDDAIGIKKAHDYANANNLPVKANPERIYTLKSGGIVVKTNTDGCGAKFIFDETSISSSTTVFSIENYQSIEQFSLTSLLKKDMTIQCPPGNGYVYVQGDSDSEKVFIRKGVHEDTGQYKTDIFRVENGNIIDDLRFDISSVGSASFTLLKPTSITFKNFVIETLLREPTTNVDEYNNMNITVTGGNITIENIEHYFNDDDLVYGYSSSGLFIVNKCVNLDIKGCKLQPHKYFNSLGSYELLISYCCNLKIDNVIISDINNTTKWGWIDTNCIKDVIVSNSKINRFDSHMGVYGLIIDNCKIGHQGVNLIGKNAEIRNCKIYSSPIVNLRSDYGSNFEGYLKLSNIDWYLLEPASSVISAVNTGDHDFGYDCHYPEVTIDGLAIHDANITYSSEPISLLLNYSSNIGSISSVEYPYLFPDSLTYKNITTDSGYGVSILGTATNIMLGESDNDISAMKTNLDINIDNVELVKYDNLLQQVNLFAAGGYSTVSQSSYTSDAIRYNKRKLPFFKIKNCKDLSLYFANVPCKLTIEDSTIREFNCSSYCNYEIYRSIFQNDTLTSSFVIVSGTIKNGTFYGCVFSLPSAQTVSFNNYKISYSFLNMYDATAPVMLLSFNAINCSLKDSSAYPDLSTYGLYFPRDFKNVCQSSVYRKKGGTSLRPISARESVTYFDTDTNTFYIYVNSEWKVSALT
ncbi:hypothetical protein [Clostridium sp. BJN0013]|uniref:hypothetical protein n=1 Tax=Clostridium sp. BJN0013 TaxID=3236840 RepID=UPI0034C68259